MKAHPVLSVFWTPFVIWSIHASSSYNNSSHCQQASNGTCTHFHNIMNPHESEVDGESMRLGHKPERSLRNLEPLLKSVPFNSNTHTNVGFKAIDIDHLFQSHQEYRDPIIRGLTKRTNLPVLTVMLRGGLCTLPALLVCIFQLDHFVNASLFTQTPDAIEKINLRDFDGTDFYRLINKGWIVFADNPDTLWVVGTHCPMTPVSAYPQWFKMTCCGTTARQVISVSTVILIVIMMIGIGFPLLF